MKQALITGITGQDGSYLAEFLLAKGYRVHGLIRRASTFNTRRIDHIYQDPHDPGARLLLHYADLATTEWLAELIYRVQPDEIYHLAAQSHVKVSFDIPDYTGDVTGLATTRILEAVRRSTRRPRFYQASSSEMFGAAPPPQDESTPFQPRSPYAAAKLYAYWQTRIYRDAYRLFACNGILFNHECVTADTPVIVRRDGLIDILPIEELVPHRKNPRHGTRYTTIPSEPVEIWDKDRWTPVTCMTATWNRGDKRVVRVAARGALFSATEDHVVFLKDRHETPAGRVRVGDELELGILPDPNPVIKMTESEAWLLGVLAGDGHVSPRGDVRVTGNDENTLNDAAMCWMELTGFMATQRVSKSGFCDNPVLSVRMKGAAEYGRYLRTQLYTEKGEKRVPYRILNAGRDVQLAFLRGYNQADGLRAGRSKYEFKSFKTASPCLAAGLWWLARVALRQRAILCVEDRQGRLYYQINLSCPHDEKPGRKGDHLRRPVQEVLRADPIRHEGWLFDLATQSGTFHAGVGEGWIHNSPRRGETFVTRKITRAVAHIAAKKQKKLYLGNLDARRDWGYAPEYVETMWKILQRDRPDDFVIGTGEARTVREFVQEAFSYAGLDWKKCVETDPRYVRPLEVDHLRANPAKARKELGWSPRIAFSELVRIMVDADLEALGLPCPGEGKKILLAKFGTWHHWRDAVTKAIRSREGKALE
jgi:GDPmannose 4,6-dehydratase